MLSQANGMEGQECAQFLIMKELASAGHAHNERTNRIADEMAKFSFEQNERDKEWVVPPRFLERLIFEDRIAFESTRL